MKPLRYRSFLLRIAPTAGPEDLPEWSFVIEQIQTSQRAEFHSLPDLFRYLLTQAQEMGYAGLQSPAPKIPATNPCYMERKK